MQNILIFLQDHWMLSLAFLGVFIFILIVEFIRTKQGALQIHPSQAIRLMNHQNAVVIDLRPTDVFQTGHIVNAVSIPFADLESKIKKLDKYKSQPILLVCANGVESRSAAQILAKHQIKTQILAGGIRGWREADLPLAKD